MSAPRLTWAERIELAVTEFRERRLLPLGLRMDRAMKRAGFRDVIVENHELRKALKHIADWPDDNMATAMTLHYDMRGWAREALRDA